MVWSIGPVLSPRPTGTGLRCRMLGVGAGDDKLVRVVTGDRAPMVLGADMGISMSGVDGTSGDMDSMLLDWLGMPGGAEAMSLVSPFSIPGGASGGKYENRRPRGSADAGFRKMEPDRNCGWLGAKGPPKWYSSALTVSGSDLMDESPNCGV